MIEIVTGDPKDYKVGTPAESGFFNNDCREFSAVTHVTHAFRTPEILRSGSLTGRLVYDDSTLNSSRIQVVWASPNHWGFGFRYGTVALALDWEELLRTRRPFWVEVAKYKVRACRILLSKQPPAGLAAYDPTTKGGPWWHDTSTGKHYFNSDHCLEFMIAGDVPLEAVTETSFVNHHSSWCSEHRTSQGKCSELGLSHQEAGPRFVARVVGSGESAIPFKTSASYLDGAWGWLCVVLLKGNAAGSVIAADPSAKALASSALWLFGTRRDEEAEALVSMFASDMDAVNAARECVEKAFGLAPGSLK